MSEPVEARTPTLDDVLSRSWRMLVEGAKRTRHPFHTPVLSTSGHRGSDLRTVVLRSVDPDARELICHTDLRSAKCAQIGRDPRVSWLFYDARAKVQLRIGGIAEVHSGDPLALERWRASPVRSRRCYGVVPGPGTPVGRADSGLSEPYTERAPTLEESDPWAEHFAVLRTRVDTMEWLYLQARGHLRARFEWSDDKLASTWLIP